MVTFEGFPTKIFKQTNHQQHKMPKKKENEYTLSKGKITKNEPSCIFFYGKTMLDNTKHKNNRNASTHAYYSFL